VTVGVSQAFSTNALRFIITANGVRKNTAARTHTKPKVD
jgi:hypothetical protein